MDHHVTQCVVSMTVVRRMDAIVGGVTYGSSAALPPLQVADIIGVHVSQERGGGSITL